MPDTRRQRGPIRQHVADVVWWIVAVLVLEILPLALLVALILLLTMMM